jgi:hypothetical protein
MLMNMIFHQYKTTDTAVISFVFSSWINEFCKYYLKHA